MMNFKNLGILGMVAAILALHTGCNQFERIVSRNPDLEGFMKSYDFNDEALTPYRVGDSVVSLFLKPHGADEFYDFRLSLRSPESGTEITVTHVAIPKLGIDESKEVVVTASMENREHLFFSGHKIVAEKIAAKALMGENDSEEVNATVTVSRDGENFEIPFQLILEKEKQSAPLR